MGLGGHHSGVGGGGEVVLMRRECRDAEMLRCGDGLAARALGPRFGGGRRDGHLGKEGVFLVFVTGWETSDGRGKNPLLLRGNSDETSHVKILRVSHNDMQKRREEKAEEGGFSAR